MTKNANKNGGSLINTEALLSLLKKRQGTLTIRELAPQLELSNQYLGLVVRGVNPPGPALAKQLGYEPVQMFRPLAGAKPLKPLVIGKTATKRTAKAKAAKRSKKTRTDKKAKRSKKSSVRARSAKPRAVPKPRVKAKAPAATAAAASTPSS